MYQIQIKGEKEPRIIDDALGKQLGELWGNEGNDRVRVRIGEVQMLCGDIKRLEKMGAQENAWTKKQGEELQENLRIIATSNRGLLSLSPEERATAEIADRILNGLTEEEKDKFSIIYEKMHEFFTNYFVNNPQMPRCPIEKWGKALKKIGIRSTLFFKAVAINDGAIARWAERRGEWN